MVLMCCLQCVLCSAANVGRLQYLYTPEKLIVTVKYTDGVRLLHLSDYIFCVRVFHVLHLNAYTSWDKRVLRDLVLLPPQLTSVSFLLKWSSFGMYESRCVL